jgi:hypothetical protein
MLLLVPSFELVQTIVLQMLITHLAYTASRRSIALGWVVVAALAFACTAF